MAELSRRDRRSYNRFLIKLNKIGYGTYNRNNYFTASKLLSPDIDLIGTYSGSFFYILGTKVKLDAIKELLVLEGLKINESRFIQND